MLALPTVRSSLGASAALLFLAALLGSGCGGKVVFDPNGAGSGGEGGGNDGTSSSTGDVQVECIVGMCGDSCIKCIGNSCSQGVCDKQGLCQTKIGCVN